MMHVGARLTNRAHRHVCNKDLALIDRAEISSSSKSLLRVLRAVMCLPAAQRKTQRNNSTPKQLKLRYPMDLDAFGTGEGLKGWMVGDATKPLLD